MFDERFTEIPGAEAWEAPKEAPRESAELEEEMNEEEAAEEVIALYDDLEPEEQMRVTDFALDKMRGVLNDVKDYAVFASTAMYLNGKRMKAMGETGPDVDALIVPAGDLDVAVGSEESLKRIQQKLARRPDVLLDQDGKIHGLTGANNDVRVLSGKLFVNTPRGKVGYDFEFFNESRIVKEDVLRNRHMIEGVQVLNLEGLQKQYLNNLDMETQIDRNVQAVADYLVADASVRADVEAGTISPETQAVLDHLALNAGEVQKFYDLQEQINQEANEKKRQDLISKRAILLSGLKTKLPKRQKNTNELAKLRGKA